MVRSECLKFLKIHGSLNFLQPNNTEAGRHLSQSHVIYLKSILINCSEYDNYSPSYCQGTYTNCFLKICVCLFGFQSFYALHFNFIHNVNAMVSPIRKLKIRTSEIFYAFFLVGTFTLFLLVVFEPASIPSNTSVSESERYF